MNLWIHIVTSFVLIFGSADKKDLHIHSLPHFPRVYHSFVSSFQWTVDQITLDRVLGSNSSSNKVVPQPVLKSLLMRKSNRTLEWAPIKWLWWQQYIIYSLSHNLKKMRIEKKTTTQFIFYRNDEQAKTFSLFPFFSRLTRDMFVATDV